MEVDCVIDQFRLVGTSWRLGMRNEMYEKELTRQGVVWEYLPEIPLDKIDVKGGISNQARLIKPLDEDLVKQYTDFYSQNMEPPPLVLLRTPRKYLPLDGNHRIAAAIQAKRSTHDAYVVICEDQMVCDRLSWSFNNKVNGLRLSNEECLEHAVSFVRKYGIDVNSASREWGLATHVVARKVRAANLTDILGRHGIQRNKALTDEMLLRLAPLESSGEDILVATTKAVRESGATIKEAEELVKSIRSKKTHDERTSRIEEYVLSSKAQARRAETKGGTIKHITPLPREKLVKLLEQVDRLLETSSDRKTFLPPTKDDTKRVRALAADVVHQLTLIYGLGTAGQLEDVG